MTMSRRNLSLETLALLRVSVIARPEMALEIPLAEPIFVLNNAVLGPLGAHLHAQQVQAILVRNPDAWRLKILQGFAAEKEGIASLDWLLDSDLVLQWGPLQLNLQISEPDQNSSRPDDRSGLFQMAATLAAGNLQLEQDKGQLLKERDLHARQRKGLARAWNKRLNSLKKVHRKINSKRRALRGDRSAIEEKSVQIKSQASQLRIRESALDKAIDRMVSLRTRAVTRWRAHIEKSLSLVEQKRAAVLELERRNLEIQAQLGPLVHHLAQEQNRINESDRRLTAERAEMRGGMDAWRREELARQGQWLQRQAELTQKENQIRAEAGLLLKLRAAVTAQLAKPLGQTRPADSLHAGPASGAPTFAASAAANSGTTAAPLDWEPILKQALDREVEIAERQASLDSWTKRLELWAGALGEREMLCSHRERELASIATEYHGLRLRREEELSGQSIDLYQREVAYFESRNKAAEQSGPSAQAMQPEQAGTGPTSVIRARKSKRKQARTGSMNGKKIDLTLGPRSLQLARREADLIQREADLARLKSDTEARGRKLAEEAIVLERYRARLLAESRDRAAGKKDGGNQEIKMLVEQWKKRTASQRQSLGSLRDYLFRLGKKLKKWSSGLALREANIVETELRLLEERTREAVSEQMSSLNQSAATRAA